ncbi:MAG TPA: non-heme iron oxygenase ferredoxin subunit [Acidothermaceae bacterium]|jgi:3-phenylpropionate/trans-cinnamate dioxygenase ferredoxin subunit|nr:non-heme iron oxygenase ferredoxin subunit [Acidothermaceae bacterium]
MSRSVKVAGVGSLPAPGGVLRVEVEGEPVAIVGSDAGDFHAISDVCSHAEVSLSDGEIDGYTVECWLHGSRFDVRTGQPLGPPATRAVPVYDITIDGDGVYVSTDPSVRSTSSQPHQEPVR